MQLDIKKGTTGVIEVYQGDSIEDEKIITLINDDKLFDLTDYTCDLAYVDVNNDYADVVGNLNIVNATAGQIELPANANITKRTGVYNCELRLKDGDGNNRYTAFFSLVVKENVFSKAAPFIENSTSFKILQDLLDKADEYNKELKNATNGLELKYANELNVLDSRMNNFTALKNGSTTGDAELADIRVGADGTKYASAGDAVRNQFNNLNVEIKDIDSIVKTKGNNILDPNIERKTDYDIKYSDSTTTINDYYYTQSYTKGVIALAKPLECEPSSKYLAIRKDLTQVGITYILFDNNGKYIKGEFGKSEIDTPDNCNKIAVAFTNSQNIPDSICKIENGKNIAFEEFGTKSDIRKDTNLINTTLEKLSNDIYTKVYKTVENLEWENGVQLSDGTFDSTDSYSHADIKVVEGDTFYITGYNFYKNLLYAVLDTNGTVIQKNLTNVDSDTTLYNNQKVVIAKGGTILRVNKREPYNGTMFTPSVKKEIIIQNSLNQLDILKNNVNAELYTRTNALVDIDNLQTGKAIMTWVKTANVADKTTYLYDSADRVYTPLYEVKKGDIYKSAYKHKQQQGFVYILFDSNGNFVEVAQNLVFEVQVKQDGFIMLDFPNKSLLPEAVVKVKSENEFPFPKEYNHVNFVKEPYFDEEKPLDVIDKTGGYMAIFHDFGVIGDSLASGNMEGIDLQGNYKYTDFLDYTWGKSIERATGCTYHRFSRGGQYLHDNNWFSEWSDKLKAEPCQAYIICIGFNDFNWLHEDSSRYGSIADVKDDFTQNPNTFYGQYAKMIQLIKSIQPKARIFLCNMEWNNTDNCDINKSIEEICNHFDKCYLLDLCKYAHEPYWNVPNIYKTGIYHKNTLGYQIMAWNVMSYIDYIVRHNSQEFIDVQFIGTDFRLPTQEEIEKEKNKNA